MKKIKTNAEQYDMIELEGLKKARSVLYRLDGGRALAITLNLNFSQNDLIINIPTKVRYTNQSS